MKIVNCTIGMMALVFACPASTLAATQDLGVINTAGTSFAGNLPGGTPWSSGPTAFTDYYTFSLAAGTGGASGGVTGTSLSFFNMGVDVTSLTLSVLGGAQIGAADTSPTSFTFSGLTTGTTYQLAVAGTVTGQPGFANWYATYQGNIAAVASVASPAPEASDLAMTALGLAGVAFWARRRAVA